MAAWSASRIRFIVEMHDGISVEGNSDASNAMDFLYTKCMHWWYWYVWT